VLDHRFGATEAEALQSAIDELSDSLAGDFLAVGDVVLETRVTELRHSLIDKILFPTPEQLTQLHPDLRPNVSAFVVRDGISFEMPPYIQTK